MEEATPSNPHTLGIERHWLLVKRGRKRKARNNEERRDKDRRYEETRTRRDDETEER